MSTRQFQPGDSYGFNFTVKNSDGSLATPSAISGAIWRSTGGGSSAADGAVTVTVAGSGGKYSASATIPNGYLAGDRISLCIDATIAGVATADFVDHVRLVGWPNTGVILAPSGLDPVVVESGVNARQALSPILAAAAGPLSGAGSGTIIIKGGNTTTTRITATTDASGDRTAVTLNLPA